MTRPMFVDVDVSRETLRDLEHFEGLVRKWNPRINLVSKNTIEDLWHRHILDGLQLIGFLPSLPCHWVDLGSGGGFPGIVIAIAAKSLNPNFRMTLVESDHRKAVFLRTAIRELNLTAKVETSRIKELASLQADVLTARALADLPILLSFADRHLKKDGVAVFPKGATWKKEVEAARAEWSFSCETTTSKTDQNAVVLSIGNIDHA